MGHLRKSVLRCTWDRVWLAFGDFGKSLRKHGSALDVMLPESRVNVTSNYLNNVCVEEECQRKPAVVVGNEAVAPVM